ncbi:MAG TPA: protein kinase [Pyrinomonadaceae bacterium]|nr:protein kinase [Pyrinomonadaceae bacterium]
MTIKEGTKIGRYEIRSQIGAGGMGEVYLAEDTLLHRNVALKLLPVELANDPNRLARFQQEAFAASALNHPNILTLFELSEADSLRFIITEHVDGETLRRRMGNRLSVRDALDVATQVASALAAAHKAGVVHRDIKPENIMIRHDDGIVKVLDFGLAKATKKLAQPIADPEAATIVNTSPGLILGTVAYMSPEQARGLAVDERTDIWSLGIVLYEMIAGRRPFEGETPSDVISTILHKEPPALTRLSDEATERLDEIATKALAKDREERYQGAKDLLIDLRRLKQHLDFESEVERTFAPELRSGTVRTSGEVAMKSAEQRTALSGAVPTKVSSAEYIVSEIKRHKKGFAVVAAAVIVLAIVVVASYLWISNRGPQALTDKDTILLADFVNTTGDAVFDGTLQQALSVQLGQSPFLNIFGDDRVREALRFMGRSADERVTRDVGREICRRHGLKALLVGSISLLGSHYVLTLEAINAQTGDALAREQVEADNKEQVLEKLGEAATKLREKLGESLASIQKFDAPLEQATTSSLEAFKAFALGDEQRNKNSFPAAIPFYERAIDLDPNFATAYTRLAVIYGNLGQLQLANEYARKAFDLRDRVSEREKFYISSNYYRSVTNEIEKNIETLELWKQEYPRDFGPRTNLADQYLQIGRFEKALAEASEAKRLNPNARYPYANMALAYMGLNRFEEAKTILQEALAQRPDFPDYHFILYQATFAQGNHAAMQQQIDWYAGKPAEYDSFNLQSQSAAYSGQVRKARELNQRAMELATQGDLKEVAASLLIRRAITDAIFGNCQQITQATTKALAIARTSDSLRNSALALALCGETVLAQTIVDEQAKLYPTDTLLNTMTLPTISAAIEMRRNNYAQAIQLLQSANRYEGRSQFFVRHIRGQAYLAQQSATEATTDFQYIVDHRGFSAGGESAGTFSPLFPLAHLGLARAAVLQGDTARARKAYQDFFGLWKDADQDIPILIEAKKEYERLT